MRTAPVIATGLLLLATFVIPNLASAQDATVQDAPLSNAPSPDAPPFNVPAEKAPAVEFQSVAANAAVTNFDQLRELAKSAAQKPFVPRPEISPVLADLTYEQYREIQFRSKRATWWERQSPFLLETFHRGFVQRDQVTLLTIEDGKAKPVEFNADDFIYPPSLQHLALLKNPGHAGIKIVSANHTQEVLTFLGSSYFRARSVDTHYGTSARGLAVNIALNRDEEFPFFKTFWIRKPKPKDKSLVALALMDSPSVCGAYEFTLQPGTIETQVAIRCELNFRSVPEKIGIAPLTSMWMWGDGLEGPPKDARPSVHDSDGLLIDGGDDGFTWRAFARQSYPSVSRININEVRGFGLLQRNRAFFHFDDHNAQYHKRPSVWVAPKEGWENGYIEILELPGAHEGIDNIGAYFVPHQPPVVGQPIRFNYTVSFFPGDHGSEKDVARSTFFTVKRNDDQIELQIRFSGDSVKHIGIGDLSLSSRLIRGKLVEKKLTATPEGDHLATLTFEPTEDGPVEVFASLQHDGKKVSETFTYLCPPQEPTFVYPQVYSREE